VPSEFIVCRSDNAASVSAAELCERLTHKLGGLHPAQVNRDGRRLALVGRGIAIRLVLVKGIYPMAAVIEVSDTAEVEDVSLLFRTFRTLRWEF
jgi:hypothetical protein